MGNSRFDQPETKPDLKISSDAKDLIQSDADRIEAQANTNDQWLGAMSADYGLMYAHRLGL